MVTEIVVGIAVLALLIARQLRSRPVSATGLALVAIIAVIGVFQAGQFLTRYHANGGTYLAIGGSLMLAIGFGVARAATMRLWRQDGQVWTRGSWLTAGLWVLALAAHLGYDALVARGQGAGSGTHSVGAATAVLYLAVSLAVQRLILMQRAQRFPVSAGDPQAPLNPLV